MDADRDLAAALRRGDEEAFERIVTAWSASMLTLARGFVSTDASAEEVVQDTWLAVVRGIDRFEGRSAVRTWAYRILVNIAKTRGVRETRVRPWSSSGTDHETGPSLDPSLFRGPGDAWPGHWRVAPLAWPAEAGVEDSILAGEVRGELGRHVQALPERQRLVLIMRDVLGHSSEEVCQVLDLSPGNQRILLHRARTTLRSALAGYLGHVDHDRRQSEGRGR